MPLIPTVGRRSARMRGLLLGIYVLLSLGAATTLYPFLIMLGASVTTDYDQYNYDIIPAYLTSDDALVAKYDEDKYNADLIALNGAYGSNFATLQTVRIAPDPSADREVDRWRAFFAAQPPMYRIAGFRGARGQYVPSKLLNQYHDWLQKRFHGNIDALGRAYIEEDTNFLSVAPPFERPLQRVYSPSETLKDLDWTRFERTLDWEWFQPVLCEALYRSYLHDEAYASGKIADLNAAWGTNFTDFTQIELPQVAPTAAGPARDWTNFVRHKLPLRFISWRAGANAIWRSYQVRNGISPVSDLPEGGVLPEGRALERYADFVASAAPNLITVNSLENRWRAATGNPGAEPPIAQDDRDYALSHKLALRLEFIGRNYRFATDFLLLHGDGIWNTIIYCAGAVLLALIVNPMCAYALSRFKMRQGAALLLFLLATMAFPAEVTMIPNFLMLKQFGMLNTYWALILPGAASGFSIFLLKGFFDSLPPELYEAGMLDGAGPLTLFTRVTLPLSGPIFAVIALQSFTAMYGAFLFAMTTEQAQRQWPLMVWIYEFQALAAPQYVMMAALVIAALPTLIIFLFAQNVIMKGIILPSFK
jgi:multiple sugar transport system permease protein